MQHLITFIVRLWLDVQTQPPTWKGQVECVADGARGPLHRPEELLAFITAHTAAASDPPPTAGLPETCEHVAAKNQNVRFHFTAEEELS